MEFEGMTLGLLGLLTATILLVFPTTCLGTFSFVPIETGSEIFIDHPCEPSCNDPTEAYMVLKCNYKTDETVSVIEWYKHPGVLIARIFGVSTGAPFTVQAPYNAAPYTVQQYHTSQCGTSTYNAAILIKGVSASDAGAYSINVTATYPHGVVLNMRPVSPLTPEDKPTVDCNKMTCIPPAAAVGVTTNWTKNGNTHRCTVRGGNAECCCDKIYAECDVSEGCYCLLALLAFLVPLIVGPWTALVLKCREKKWNVLGLIYHLLLFHPVLGWLCLIPSFSEKCRISREELYFNKKEKIYINSCTTIGLVTCIILNFIVSKSQAWICFLVSSICMVIGVVFMILKMCSCIKDKTNQNEPEKLPIEEEEVCKILL